ncbi:MAG: ribosome maturation factor RimM [Candidatus Marinimicrobia bacterium]|nr:ribosome maturation factor RimM [Candidatus Neomarinimicrobiota bacterium]
MQATEVNRIAIGVVRKPHGVQGGLKVTLNNIDLDTLRGMEQLFVKSGREWTQLSLKSIQGYDDYAILRFAEIENRNEADNYRDQVIYVDRDALPDQLRHEPAVDDIIGCQVEDENKLPLGIVEDILSTGAHEVLVVLSDAGETLIPLVDEWIVRIDLKDKFIQVRAFEEM